MREKYKLSNSDSHELTSQSIHAAFDALALEKKVSDITVSELCKKADVSRQGFYRNYGSVREIFEEKIQNMLKRFLDYELNPLTYESGTFFRNMIRFYVEDEAFFLAIIRSGEDMLLLDAVTHAFSEEVQRQYHTPMQDLIFWQGGSYMVIRDWLMRGRQEPEEEIVRFLESNMKTQ